MNFKDFWKQLNIKKDSEVIPEVNEFIADELKDHDKYHAEADLVEDSSKEETFDEIAEDERRHARELNEMKEDTMKADKLTSLKTELSHLKSAWNGEDERGNFEGEIVNWEDKIAELEEEIKTEESKTKKDIRPYGQKMNSPEIVKTDEEEIIDEKKEKMSKDDKEKYFEVKITTRDSKGKNEVSYSYIHAENKQIAEENVKGIQGDIIEGEGKKIVSVSAVEKSQLRKIVKTEIYTLKVTSKNGHVRITEAKGYDSVEEAIEAIKRSPVVESVEIVKSMTSMQKTRSCEEIERDLESANIKRFQLDPYGKFAQDELDAQLQMLQQELDGATMREISQKSENAKTLATLVKSIKQPTFADVLHNVEKSTVPEENIPTFAMQLIQQFGALKISDETNLSELKDWLRGKGMTVSDANKIITAAKTVVGKIDEDREVLKA